jgi:hypothetical protein
VTWKKRSEQRTGSVGMGTRTPKPVAQLLDTNHAAIRIQLVGVYFLHFFIVDIKFLLYFIIHFI